MAFRGVLAQASDGVLKSSSGEAISVEESGNKKSLATADLTSQVTLVAVLEELKTMNLHLSLISGLET